MGAHVTCPNLPAGKQGPCIVCFCPLAGRAAPCPTLPQEQGRRSRGNIGSWTIRFWHQASMRLVCFRKRVSCAAKPRTGTIAACLRAGTLRLLARPFKVGRTGFPRNARACSRPFFRARTRLRWLPGRRGDAGRCPDLPGELNPPGPPGSLRAGRLPPPIPSTRKGRRFSDGPSFCFPYSMTFVTTPEPTVRPPSRMAKRSPSSHAIGVIRLISMSMLSPGITISTPSGSLMFPVTSVVRK